MSEIEVLTVVDSNILGERDFYPAPCLLSSEKPYTTKAPLLYTVSLYILVATRALPFGYKGRVCEIAQGAEGLAGKRPGALAQAEQGVEQRPE
jgi:hypothetical protein